MQIMIRTPICGNSICSLLENFNQGEVAFHFLSQQGINWTYEVFGLAGEEAEAFTKAIIKATEFGKVLNFSVVAG